MAIYVQALFNAVTSQMGTGSGGQRVNQDFIFAVNDALNELSYKNDKATKLGNIDDIADTISDIDNQQFYILRAGTRFHMLSNGHYSSDPKLAKIEMDNARRNWQEGKDDFWTGRVNALNAGDSTDVIGNGYLD